MQHKITTSHGDIAVTGTSGNGPTILFIHGNSSCKDVFSSQLHGGIGADFRCYAMDLPGHGESDDAGDPARTYNIPGYADVAMQVMQALHAGPFYVMGWSLGGHIAIEMMASCPRIAGVMISGTPPIGEAAEDMPEAFLPHPHMALTGQDTFTDQQAEDYARTTCGSRRFEPFLARAVHRTDGRARRLMMESALRGDGVNQRQTVQSSAVPLAIVNGAEEALVNNHFVASLSYANLWRGQVILLDDAGHAPFWDAPDAFNGLLRAFITDVEQQQA